MDQINFNNSSLADSITNFRNSVKINTTDSIRSLLDDIEVNPMSEVTPLPPAAVTPLQNLL